MQIHQKTFFSLFDADGGDNSSDNPLLSNILAGWRRRRRRRPIERRQRHQPKTSEKDRRTNRSTQGTWLTLDTVDGPTSTPKKRKSSHPVKLKWLGDGCICVPLFLKTDKFANLENLFYTVSGSLHELAREKYDTTKKTSKTVLTAVVEARFLTKVKSRINLWISLLLLCLSCCHQQQKPCVIVCEWLILCSLPRVRSKKN